MFFLVALLSVAAEAAPAKMGFVAKVENLLKKQQYEKAVKVATDLIEEQGMIDADPMLFNLRGEAYFRIGKFNEAILDLTKFIYAPNLDTKDTKIIKNAYSLRGQCNLIIGNVEDATIDSNKSGNITLVKQIKSMKFQVELALASEKNKIPKDALEHFTKALRFAPFSVEYLVKAADCALQIGNATAFDEFSHLIFKIDAKNPMYLMLIGLDSFEKNDLSLASARFKKCSTTNNKCMRLLKATKKLQDQRSHASRLIREKKFDDAAPLMQQCLDIVKLYAKPESNVSLSLDILNVKILIKKGKQNEALKTLDNLVKQYPNNTEIRLDRGEIFLELSDYDDAISDFSVVSRKDSTNKRAQAGLKKASELRDKEKHQNYYDLLGVKKGCTDSELKNAFRKAVNTWHPDRHKDPMKKKEAEKKMKMINKAMDVLGDKEKRKMYDAGYDPEAPPPPPEDDPRAQQYQQYQQQQGGGGGPGGFNFGGGNGDFFNIFSQMMGGQGGGGGGGQRFFQGGGPGGQQQQQQQRRQNSKKRR